MSDGSGYFAFMVIIIVAFIIGFIVSFYARINEIQCYQDYIETNVITTRCEKYFKELKLGSDSNE